MTLKEQFSEILESYRKSCFLVKDNLDHPKAVNLMAVTNINTVDALIQAVEADRKVNNDTNTND